MTLTIMCGLPYSGKTTKATALATETGAVMIRRDEYNAQVVTPTTWITEEHLQQITNLALADVRRHLAAGEDVIYDATNTTKAERQEIRNECDVDGCRYVCVFMDTPEETCFERDGFIFARMLAKTMEPPTEDEGYEIVTVEDVPYEAEPSTDEILNTLLGVNGHE